MKRYRMVVAAALAVFAVTAAIALRANDDQTKFAISPKKEAAGACVPSGIECDSA